MNTPAVKERPEVDLDRLVVICGVGRSGTSLLQSMLNAHPALCLPPETHFFRRYLARGRQKFWESAGYPRLAAALLGDFEFARAGIPAEDVIGPETGRICDLGRTYRRLLRSCAERQRKPRVGDKDPLLLDHLEELHRLFPQARVLHVVRDPRDVLLSRTKAAWSRHRPWWAQSLVCGEQLRRGRERGRRLYGEAYREVRYEALVREPRRTLAEVCAHVGLEYDDAMLDFEGSARQLVSQRELSWKQETLGPLLPNNTEKWRDGLSAFQVRFTESACADSLRELGYARAEAPRRLRPDQHLVLGLAPLLRAAAGVAYDLRRLLGGGA